MLFFFIQMLIAVLFKAVQIENNPNIHHLENTECSYNEIVIKYKKKKPTKYWYQNTAEVNL